MAYYEVDYTQKRGPIALDGLLTQSGEAIVTEKLSALVSEPSTVGAAGSVIDILGSDEGVMILQDSAPPTVGSDLTTSKWVATVKSVSVTTLTPPIVPLSATPPASFELASWRGQGYGTGPVRLFDQTWSDNNLISWYGKTYGIPDIIYPKPLLIGFESSPDTSYAVGDGLVTRTSDGTAYKDNHYMRLLRNLTTSIYPGFLIPYTFNNDSKYRVSIWARVPTAAAAAQVLYVRHNLTTFGTNYWGAQQQAIPKDGVWHEYIFDFTLSTELGIDSYAGSAWWVQHAGMQNDANGFLDIDSVTITYSGRT